MPSKQVLTVIVLVAVFSWSAVMAAIGQLTAVAVLVPSLGLLVQQIAQALSSTEPPSAPAAVSAAAPHVPGPADEDEDR
jgi:hypothetical protein